MGLLYWTIVVGPLVTVQLCLHKVCVFGGQFCKHGIFSAINPDPLFRINVQNFFVLASEEGIEKMLSLGRGGDTVFGIEAAYTEV